MPNDDALKMIPAAIRATDQRVAPLDPKDQVRGNEQHDNLHANGHEHGQELASQNGRLRCGRGEQARQGALLFLSENALRGGCAGEEGIEDHHPAHDGTDDAKQKILTFCRIILWTAGWGVHIQQFLRWIIALSQRDIQIVLDNLPSQRILACVRFIDEDIHRDLDARHPIHESG